MKIQSLPKEVLVELIHYLADYERFEGLESILGGDFPMEDARAALRELAVQLRLEFDEEREETSVGVSPQYLSVPSKKLLSALSPREEKKLLKAFGFFKN